MPDPAADSLRAEGPLAAGLRLARGPRAFFRAMPRDGGYAPPLLFAAALAAVGVGGRLLWSWGAVLVFRLGAARAGQVAALAAGMLLVDLLVLPVILFAAAGALHGLWRLLGSRQPFQASFRCVAYSSCAWLLLVAGGAHRALALPGLVAAAGLALFLLATASEEVHGLERRRLAARLGRPLLVAAAVVALGAAGLRVWVARAKSVPVRVPAEVSGMTLKGRQGATGSTVAHALYAAPGGGVVELVIRDTKGLPGAAGVLADIARPRDARTRTGYERSFRLGRRPGLLRYDAASRGGTAEVVIGGRLIAATRGAHVEPDLLIRLIGALDFDELERRALAP